MTLSMSLRQRLSPRIEQRQEQQLDLRLSLLLALRGGTYKPKGDCLKCGRPMTYLEILQGFRDDPNDLTTECTGCHHRFAPKLYYRSDYGTDEIAFFCSLQSLARLEDMGSLPADEIRSRDRGLYHSAIFDFGSLANAFKGVGVVYPHDEISG